MSRKGASKNSSTKNPSPKNAPNKDGGAAKGDDEHRSEVLRPTSVLERGLVKFHLRPKQIISEGPSKELIPEESSKDGGASEEKSERLSERRPPQVRIANDLVKLRLRPKENVSKWSPKELVRKKAPRMVALPKNMCSESLLPKVLEKSLVKLQLGPKERASERCFKQLVSEESSEDGGAYEEWTPSASSTYRQMFSIQSRQICCGAFPNFSTFPWPVLWSLEFGAGVFHGFLLINFVGTSYCRTHCRTYCRNQLWPLNRSVSRPETCRRTLTSQTEQLSEEFLLESVIVGADLVASEVCFDRNFECGVFAMGKWLRIACSLTSVFSYHTCISRHF